MIKNAYWIRAKLPKQASGTEKRAELEAPLYEGVVCRNCGWLGLPEDEYCYVCKEQLPVNTTSPRFVKQLTALDQLPFRPFQHQLDCALRVLGEMWGTALLCDEVGLGKTIETGLIVRELLLRGLVSRFLILVPASLLIQWAEELKLKFAIEAVLIRRLSDWEALQDQKSGCFLISHELARRADHAEVIQSKIWDLLVVDEAHKLKNRKTLLHRLIQATTTTYKLLLTATPIQNNLIELYNLVMLIDPEHFGSLQDFKADYIEGRDSRNPKNVFALRRSLKDVMVRQTRLEAGVNWVGRRAGIIEIELPENEKSLYQQMTSYIRAKLKTADGGKNLLTLLLLQKEVSSSPQALLKTLEVMMRDSQRSEQERRELQTLAALAQAIHLPAKMEAVIQVVQASKEKFLIFSDYVETVFALQRALNKEGISALVFHGGLNLLEKEQTIEAFKKDVRVLLSTESGSEGRNLQFCHQVLNMDLPWNPMKLEQRIGRVHRLGQTREVSVYSVVAENTIETYILDLLATKIRLFELVVGELDMILGNLDRKRSLEDLLIEVWKRSLTDDELKEGFEKLGLKAVRARKEYRKMRRDEAKWSDLFSQPGS